MFLDFRFVIIKKGEIVEASFMMMNQAILMMPKAQVIDSRLQDQASRIQSKIQDSREEIKKQQVKTSYRISIKRFFQKPNSTVLFYKRIFSNFLSYQRLIDWIFKQRYVGMSRSTWMTWSSSPIA